MLQEAPNPEKQLYFLLIKCSTHLCNKFWPAFWLCNLWQQFCSASFYREKREMTISWPSFIKRLYLILTTSQSPFYLFNSGFVMEIFRIIRFRKIFYLSCKISEHYMFLCARSILQYGLFENSHEATAIGVLIIMAYDDFYICQHQHFGLSQPEFNKNP